MAEPEGRASFSYLRSTCRDFTAAPFDWADSGSIALAPGSASEPSDGIPASAPRRASHRPKVSVMLITYNHAGYIAQALESVLMQETDFDFEINVIEDCSTDGTQDIVMRYVQRYPHIVKPYFNEKNIGFEVTQKNFYRGFKTLTGEYFAILEGDDYWISPHKLQRQVDFLEANPDFAICAHNTLKVYDDGSMDPHRFLYWGRREDATVKEVICLQAFFHTTGVLYRNVFNGNPPRHYRSKWSCDIFVMISHAAFGKVHHIDEDWAVYRAHAGGRFSGMGQTAGWLYNIDSLRRYNAWLGYRYARTFAESIARYCAHVLRAHGKDGAAPLNPYQLMRIVAIWACYRSLFHLLGVPPTVIFYLRLLAKFPRALPKALARLVARARTPRRRTRLFKLPLLQGSAHWDLIWGLNAKTIDGLRVVPDHPVLRLTAVRTNDRAEQDRHALSECISGLAPGGSFRVSFWVKSTGGTNVQLHLRDSVSAETGIPRNEGEARYDLSSSSVMMVNGLSSSGVEPDLDGWQKVWADITTDDGRIFAYLGLLKISDSCHCFKPDGEAVLFGGIEISHQP